LAVNSFLQRFEQSINCPRCFVRLCVIQFTRYRSLPAWAVSLLILSRLFPLVKNFFSLFSTIFSGPRHCFGPLPEASRILPKSSPFVKP